jgi:hypothetical protein
MMVAEKAPDLIAGNTPTTHTADVPWYRHGRRQTALPAGDPPQRRGPTHDRPLAVPPARSACETRDAA